MPFVAIEHAIAFAIDAAAKASDMQQLDQNVDYIYANQVTNGDAHDHINGDGGGLAGASFVNAVPGNFVDTPKDTSGSNNSLTYTATGAAITVLRGGAYRVRWSHNPNSIGSGTCHTKVYKNGGAVGVEKINSTSTSPIAVSDDITGLVAGDILQIYAYRTGSSSLSSVSGMHLCVSQATSILSGVA